MSGNNYFLATIPRRPRVNAKLLHAWDGGGRITELITKPQQCRAQRTWLPRAGYGFSALGDLSGRVSSSQRPLAAWPRGGLLGCAKAKSLVSCSSRAEWDRDLTLQYRPSDTWWRQRAGLRSPKAKGLTSRPGRVRARARDPDQEETTESERCKGTKANIRQHTGRSCPSESGLITCKPCQLSGTSGATNFYLLSFLCWTIQPPPSLFFPPTFLHLKLIDSFYVCM